MQGAGASVVHKCAPLRVVVNADDRRPHCSQALRPRSVAL